MISKGQKINWTTEGMRCIHDFLNLPIVWVSGPPEAQGLKTCSPVHDAIGKYFAFKSWVLMGPCYLHVIFTHRNKLHCDWPDIMNKNQIFSLEMATFFF